MIGKTVRWTLAGLLVAGMIWLAMAQRPAPTTARQQQREEVLFWHFWGGADREVVDDVVRRFNDSQTTYFVRAVAMPGNNLDLKVFLAVTGGDPPDLVNQDDPIVADWASRGALLPLDQFVPADEIGRLRDWLLPAAVRLGEYQGRLYAVCNGLDIRALYYNTDILEQHGLSPPTTLAELDRIAVETSVQDADGTWRRIGYLPDPRRLWAWGIVFGGRFYDPQQARLTLDDPAIAAAMQWMQSYRERFGANQVAAFRQGDQSLPGKTFPLLKGRYAMVMDGQWRVRDIDAEQRRQRAAGETPTRFGVCPLPPPPGGRSDAGWVNGNFFVVPRGARQPDGAWQFMKFWCGFDGHERQAATTCVAGGWIPVSSHVSNQPAFQAYLDQQPLFRQFVRLSASDHQLPTPVIPGAPLVQREVNELAARVMFLESRQTAAQMLSELNRRLQQQLDRRRGR